MRYFSRQTVFTPILEKTVFIRVPPDQPMYSNRIHNIEQTLIAIYIVVHHIACRHLVEQLLGTRDFRLLNGTQLKTFHCAFRFSYEENMLNRTFIESNCPVRRIVAHRRGDLKGSRQLGIDTHLVCRIQIFSKFSLNALIRRSIREHIVLNGFLCKKCLIKALRCLFSREDRAVIFTLAPARSFLNRFAYGI